MIRTIGLALVIVATVLIVAAEFQRRDDASLEQLDQTHSIEANQ